MEQPRCGMPDHMSHTSIFNDSKYSITPGNQKWPPSKRSLSYTFDPPLIDGGLSLDQWRQAFLHVFKQYWSQATNQNSHSRSVLLELQIL
ncbi:hypothetical protein K1719_016066 [Acacia pycnantha]|nr:hypothetical protein K1719_016066 [Acacia pycnantha]